jgi:hypothetical protein
MINTDSRTALWGFTSHVDARAHCDARVARLISNDHTIRGCGFNMERTAQRSAASSPGASSGLNSRLAAGLRATVPQRAHPSGNMASML